MKTQLLKMKFLKFLLALIILFIKVDSSSQTLIAGWDFQTTTYGGTALGNQDAAQPTLFNANFGSGILYLDGTNGSSSWISSNANTREINAFAGTNVNATNNLSVITTSPAALAVLNTSANGKIIVFSFFK